MNRTNLAAAAAGIAISLATSHAAVAAEGGTSFYMLGSKTTMGGYLPGPGVYAADSNYLYSGSAGFDIPVGGGKLSGNIDATAFVDMPTILWVTDGNVLGGNLAFSITEPLIYKSVSAGAFIGGKKLGAIDEDNFALGDTVLGSTLGWHSGNLHYSLGAVVNVPIGQWEKGNPVNAGFNRWAVDATGALTYLDPRTGLELSGAAGITFNAENPDTNYKTGTEFHLESAAMMHLSQAFSIGVNAYMYRQLTGDSGSGATLGAFKGSVNAIGPAIDYTFLVGRVPVSTSLRYFHEFGAEKRMEGDAGFLNIAMPLSVAGQ